MRCTDKINCRPQWAERAGRGTRTRRNADSLQAFDPNPNHTIEELASPRRPRAPSRVEAGIQAGLDIDAKTTE